MWVKIYYGHYEINKKGVVRRRTPASGTRPGLILTPYLVGNDGYGFVKLCRGPEFEPKQVRVDVLLARAFKRK